MARIAKATNKFYEEMFACVEYNYSRLLLKDDFEAEWESFKKWAIKQYLIKWDLQSPLRTGTELWWRWWNIQEEKEKKDLEKRYQKKKIICDWCGEEKDKDQFHKIYSKEVIGRRVRLWVYTGTGICKSCFEADRAARKEISEEHKKELRRQWYQAHKEEIAAKQKANRAARNEANRKYAKSHREQINQYISNRKQTDPLYKLKCQVRQTVLMSFKRTGNVKSEKCEAITGLNADALVNYLLGTYEEVYGVPWDKQSAVHIDHIIPLATAKTEEEVMRLCHYTNLRLITARDNIKKGAKLDYAIGKEVAS